MSLHHSSLYTLEDFNDELHSHATRLEPDLIEFRRMLHRNPEPAFQETFTSDKIASVLRALGLKVQTGVGGTGVVAEVEGGRPGPVIALRADMDALPIQEESGLSFASERPGLMHACGHDAHSSILVGAAELLVGMREKLSGKVRLLFQPAEEINAGARAMIAAGVLEGVDEIYALHNHPGLPAGRVAVRRGPMMGSVDRIEISLEGKGGHGAIPDVSIDPIVAASAIVMGLQTAVSREISPFDSAVVTIGSFLAGEANNVIPHRAELTGTVRTFSPAVQAGMRERLERIVAKIAEAYRCKAELRYIEQTPVLVGNDACIGHVEAAACKLFGDAALQEASPTMAGEDFSVFLQKVPGCLFWFGSGPETGAESSFGLHHPRFVVNEACLLPGAMFMATIAISRSKSLPHPV
jgi:amidohydrolase